MIMSPLNMSSSLSGPLLMITKVNNINILLMEKLDALVEPIPIVG